MWRTARAVSNTSRTVFSSVAVPAMGVLSVPADKGGDVFLQPAVRLMIAGLRAPSQSRPAMGGAFAS